MIATIVGLILGAMIIFYINKDTPKYQRYDEQTEIAEKIYKFILNRKKEIFFDERDDTYYDSAFEVSLLIEISSKKDYFNIKMLNTLSAFTIWEYYCNMDEEECVEAEIDIVELEKYFQKYLK